MNSPFRSLSFAKEREEVLSSRKLLCFSLKRLTNVTKDLKSILTYVIEKVYNQCNKCYEFVYETKW
jgi:hypothetical protein